MKKIISIVLLLLVVLVGGLILGPSMVDWNKYKPEILSQLRQLTGHEYGIAGNIELAIVPQPRVKIDGLSVGMPQNLGGSTIASLERVAVNVELMPLLQKQIVIKSVELVKPVFNLGVRADGTAVWMTPELQAKLDAGKAVTAEPRRAAGDALAHAIALHQIRIKEGSFSYSDEAKKTSTALDQINLDIEGGSLFGPYKIEGQVAYKNQPVTVAIKTTKVADFNAAIPVQAQFNLPSGGTVLTYSGVVATKPSLEVQGEAAFKTNSLAEVIKALTGTINPALAKPLKVTGILTYNTAGADYKNVALNIAGSEATGSVMIKNIAKDAGTPMDVVLSLKSDQLSLDDLWPSPANTAPQKKQ
ncbi:MAG TPA: AsmA family protein, partial [Micavibrio sp.]